MEQNHKKINDYKLKKSNKSAIIRQKRLNNKNIQ